MPLNSAIPLQAQAPDSRQMLADLLNVRQQQEQAQRQQQQDQLAAQQAAQVGQMNALKLDEAQQERRDRISLDDAFKGGFDRDAILAAVPGHLQAGVRKQFQEIDDAALKAKETKAKLQESEKDYFGALASGVKAHGYDLQAASIALAHAKESGYQEADQLWDQIQGGDQSQIQQVVDSLIAQSPKYSALERQSEAQQETARHNVVQETAAATTAKTALADKTADNARLQAQADEVARHNKAMEARPVSGAAGSTDDAGSIADAIINGDQPPVLTGLYRLAGPVRAALAKAKYNLTDAMTDWTATQKHVATLNGAKFTQLQSSIATASDSLEVIQNLADRWKGGRFPLLNKASLAAAKNGVYGKDAAAIATQLEGQITDVVSELGQVYMGGNSPTDHALQLAEKNLRADWDQKVLTDMISLARTNLAIRKNSIMNSRPAGASADNPYAPSATPAVAPPTGRFNPATGKVE